MWTRGLPEARALHCDERKRVSKGFGLRFLTCYSSVSGAGSNGVYDIDSTVGFLRLKFNAVVVQPAGAWGC